MVDPDLALEGARNLVGKWSGRLNLSLSMSETVTYISRVGTSGRVRNRFGKEEGKSCIHENCFSAACERFLRSANVISVCVSDLIDKRFAFVSVTLCSVEDVKSL